MIKADLHPLIDMIDTNLDRYRENGFVSIAGLDTQILTEGYELYEYTLCKMATDLVRKMLNDIGKNEPINEATPSILSPEEFLMKEVIAGFGDTIDEQNYRLEIVEILKVDKDCLFRKSRQDEVYERRHAIIDMAFMHSLQRGSPIPEIMGLENDDFSGGALANFLNRPPSP